MLFQWTALRAGQFRLLKQRRPLPDGQLSYELQTASIGAVPLYAVVAYAPTVAPKDHPVLVNGRTMTVSKHTHAALKEVSNLGEHDLIWIDCLSIHESDTGEKTRQEEVSARIYGAAECIYICQDPDADAALKLPAVNTKKRVLLLRAAL